MRFLSTILLLAIIPLPAAETYDIVITGATPAGIAAAVRSARRGHTVLLTDHRPGPGGMLSNGLLQWDALSPARRSPIYDEFLDRTHAFYAEKYGADSPEQSLAKLVPGRYPIASVEPHVFEKICGEMLSAEKNITTVYKVHVSSASISGRAITTITLAPHEGAGSSREVSAKIFIDATYEGDLAAAAKVPYRVGREARDEFDEPHAGKVFTKIKGGKFPKVAVEGKLAIFPYYAAMDGIDPQSPHTADGAIQAYNYRPTLTRNPEHRIPFTAPPEGYDRKQYLNFERRYFGAGDRGSINGLSSFNAPILPGENHAYPEADWETRNKILARHKNFALGLIWFLQNDETIPENKRTENKQWGLSKLDWPDNGHLPYDMYVREARRISGRTTYTEHDNSLAKGLDRSPVSSDSIAITDWYMDSHSCTLDSSPGYPYDGKLILTEESRPGMIPYRTLLPENLDNLLVPVCLSATHVAWGAVRLEPVWTQTGEAAGFAASLALEKQTTPGELDPALLIRALAEERLMLAFFNDIDMENPAPWVPAVQWAATKGYFSDYDARPEGDLFASVAKAWTETFAALTSDSLDANARAVALHATDRSDTTPVTAASFAAMLEEASKTEITPHPVAAALKTLAFPPEKTISRANACLLMFTATKE